MVAGLEMSCFFAHLSALQNQAYLEKKISLWHVKTRWICWEHEDFVTEVWLFLCLWFSVFFFVGFGWKWVCKMFYLNFWSFFVSTSHVKNLSWTTTYLLKTIYLLFSYHKSFTLPNVHLHMMHVSFPSSQFKLRNVIYLKYKVSKTSWISR